jgi:hypothetical protein
MNSLQAIGLTWNLPTCKVGYAQNLVSRTGFVSLITTIINKQFLETIQN